MFYSNEHEPIHVHVIYNEFESKVEFIIENGIITEIIIRHVKGRNPIQGSKLQDLKDLLEFKSEEIVQKWVDFFVYHKNINFEKNKYKAKMIITQNYSEVDVKVINIVEAKLINDYVIHFIFDDKVEREIDFYPFFNASKNLMTRKYLEAENFKNFSIKYGDIVWNDYEMCFPIWDLYSGKI